MAAFSGMVSRVVGLSSTFVRRADPRGGLIAAQETEEFDSTGTDKSESGGLDIDDVPWDVGNITYFQGEDPQRCLAILLEKQLDLVSRYSFVVFDFLETVRYRSQVPGYPEHVLGERALEAVIETLFKSEPTTRALNRAREISMCPPPPLKPDEFNDMTLAYVRRSCGSLSVLALSRPFVVTRFFRNLRRLREDMAVYLLALHIEYIDRRNVVPY